VSGIIGDSSALYYQRKTSLEALNWSKNLLAQFVGIDLATSDSTESGLVGLGRKREILRMDKQSTNAQIINYLAQWAPLQHQLIVIDLPKNTSIPGRFRYEELKYHPLRLIRPVSAPGLNVPTAATPQRYMGRFVKKPTEKITETTAYSQYADEAHVVTNRFSERGYRLAGDLREQGANVMLCFSHWSKARLGLETPFRSRSSLGCKALQTGIQEKLQLPISGNNLLASSLLEAMVSAYAGWLVYQGKPEEHYRLYQDERDFVFLDVLKPMEKTVKPKRMWRRKYR
jgi:hypothetical protein